MFRAEAAQFRDSAAQALPWLLLLAAVFYAAQLTTFRISVDDEFAGVRAGDASVWVSQGRWGLAAFEAFVMPQTVVPFLPTALFGLFTSVGYLLFLRAHGILRLSGRHYAAFPIFVAFPIWYFLLAFAANTPAAGLAVLFVGVALVAFRATMRPRLRAVLGWRLVAALVALQVVMATLAIAIYQSFVVLLAAGGIGVVLVGGLQDQTPIRQSIGQLALLALVTAAAVLLYVAIWRAIPLPAGTDTSYIQSFMQPGELLSHPVRVLATTAVELRKVYAGSPTVYGMGARSFGLIPVLGVLAVLLTRRMRGAPAVRLLAFAGLAALLALPFAQNLVNSGAMPYRSLVAVPAVLWICTLLAFESGRPWLARAAVAVALAAGTQSLSVAASFQAAAAAARVQDERLAAGIYDRIGSVNPAFGQGAPSKVEFFGAIPVQTIYPIVAYSTIGAPVFWWDNGNSRRIIRLYRVLGYSGITGISVAERIQVQPEFAAMGVWPAASSVKVVGDITLVKLGVVPGAEQLNLTAAAPP